MTDVSDFSDIDEDRRIERGHLAQWIATLDDGQVRVYRQRRKHRFGQGTSTVGPRVPVYSGTIQEARETRSILADLLDGHDDPVPDEADLDDAIAVMEQVDWRDVEGISVPEAAAWTAKLRTAEQGGER